MMSMDIINKVEKLFIKGLIRIVILHLVHQTNMRGYQVYKLIKRNIYKDLSLSTLYTILKEMEKLGLIKKRETMYMITEKGLTTLIKIHEKYPFMRIVLNSLLDRNVHVP